MHYPDAAALAACASRALPHQDADVCIAVVKVSLAIFDLAALALTAVAATPVLSVPTCFLMPRSELFAVCSSYIRLLLNLNPKTPKP